MSKFREALKKLKENKAIRESGKQLCIPYPFPRLSEILPGIEKGQSIGVTAGTGISKSKFTRYVFVYSIYNYMKANPTCGIKPEVFLFLLEDPASRVMNNMICHRLSENYKIDLKVQDLESKGTILSDDILAKIKECDEYFEDFEKIIHIIDNIHNPYGIYKEVKDFFLANGTVEYEIKTTEKGEKIKIPKLYTPNDPETHIIVVVDNLSNLNEEEKHASQWDAIGEWTSKYCRRLLCKFFGATTVNIQQQDLESQKLTFSSYQGEAIKGKVKPSLGALGDNKTTSRDYHVIFGIFSPDRFEFENDLGYDITLLQNHYRNLSILKSNESESGYELGLYFNGATEKFIELPHPKRQPKELHIFYDNYKIKYGKE